VSFELDATTLLSDIVENIDRIQSYLLGLDRGAFERDSRTQDAVERCLQRICEAAARLGDRAAELMPAQPWSEIRGMGNHLRHAYDRLSLDIVWDVVARDLPELASDAREALKALEQA